LYVKQHYKKSQIYATPEPINEITTHTHSQARVATTCRDLVATRRQ